VLAAVAPGGLAPAPSDPLDPVRSATSAQPDIVLVVTDDQRPDTLGGMPEVQRLLVDRGVRFSNMMVPTSLCCPSRATILTGRYAHHTGVYGNGDVGGPSVGGYAQVRRRGLEFGTIATTLSGAGYRTALVGKYFNYFSKYAPDGYVPPGWDDFMVVKFARDGYYDYRLSDGSWHGHEPADYSTDVLAERAVDFVHTTPQHQPLFLMLTPYAPHSPYRAAPRHTWSSVAAETDRLPRAVAAYRASDPAPARPAWRRHRQRTVQVADLVRQGQRATLRAVDDAVAELVRALEERGSLHNTLFVFTSDNGYLWGEHGMVGKDAPYDAALRVPLVVRWDAELPAGRVDHRLALNVDLARTLTAAAGTAMRTDGLDLLGPARRRGFPVEATAGYGGRPAYCGWRTHRWLYVRYADGDSELFDYRRDPYELHNRAGRRAVSGVQHRLHAKAVAHCRPTPPGFGW
jgi:arylsulfatase A-like enzyme